MVLPSSIDQMVFVNLINHPFLSLIGEVEKSRTWYINSLGIFHHR